MKLTFSEIESVLRTGDIDAEITIISNTKMPQIVWLAPNKDISFLAIGFLSNLIFFSLSDVV